MVFELGFRKLKKKNLKWLEGKIQIKKKIFRKFVLVKIILLYKNRF